MTKEEITVKDILKKFSTLQEKIITARQRRIFIEVTLKNYLSIIEYMKNSLSFTMLCTITGLDIAEEFQVIYHLSNDEGLIVSLKLNIDKKAPTISTITNIFAGATLYERELIDMFGINVTGLPDGERYPLPDGWPKDQHPLRKDWKANDSAVPQQ